MELIYEGLNKSVSRWTDAAYLKLHQYLHKHPTHRSAAIIEGSKTGALDVCGQTVWLLSILLCDEGPLGDFHLIIYIGPEASILKKRDEKKRDVLVSYSNCPSDDE